MQRKFLNAYIDLIDQMNGLANSIVEEEVGGLVEKEADNIHKAADLLRENLSLNGIQVDAKKKISFSEARRPSALSGAGIGSGREDRPAQDQKKVVEAEPVIYEEQSTQEHEAQPFEETVEEKAPADILEIETIDAEELSESIPDPGNAETEEPVMESVETEDLPHAKEETVQETVIAHLPETYEQEDPTSDQDSDETLTSKPQEPVVAASSEESSDAPEVQEDLFGDDPKPEDSPMYDLFSVVSNAMGKIPPEKTRLKKHTYEAEEAADQDDEKAKDIRFIKESDLCMTYKAFTIRKKDDEIGHFDIFTCPIDPSDPGGRFFYWIINYETGVSEAGASDTNNGAGCIKYQPEGYDFYINISATKRRDLQIFVPKKFGEVETIYQEFFGDQGHVVLHDQGTILHLFPLEFKNDEDTNTADCVCMIEENGTFKPVMTENGYMDITANGKQYKLSAAWSNSTLYSKIA